jgi:hypothetical protein
MINARKVQIWRMLSVLVVVFTGKTYLVKELLPGPYTLECEYESSLVQSVVRPPAARED